MAGKGGTSHARPPPSGKVSPAPLHAFPPHVVHRLPLQLLDFPHLIPARPSILRIMSVLTKRSGLYPTSLGVRGVEKKGEFAVNGGSFGDIWEGTVGGIAVAIKVMRKPEPDLIDVNTKVSSHFLVEVDGNLIIYLCQAFLREAVLWRQFYHPNVLPFYGMSTWPQDPRIVCLISPWMRNGNIVEYLGKTPQANRLLLVRRTNLST